MKTFLKLAYAPVMLIGGNFIALDLIADGAPPWTLIPLVLTATTLSFAAEWLVPYEPGWNESRGDAARDAVHAVVNESLSVAGLALIPLLAGHTPFASLWPRHWPLAYQWLFAVGVADAGITLAHWASHRWAWLWKFHAVHHSVERMYGLNGLMKHPLHQAIETSAGVLPLLLIGLPRPVAALLAFSVALQLLLQHANVDMRIGLVRHLLALAPVHRFHHRKHAGIGDVNFGLFTTIWDRLLGTAVDDASARFGLGDFGIGDRPDYPRSYLAQMIEPFRRTASRTIDESLRHRDAEHGLEGSRQVR